MLLQGLKLISCEMVDTDLCFEKSDVEATIVTPVVSIKIPGPAGFVSLLWEKSSETMSMPEGEVVIRPPVLTCTGL